MGSTTNQLLAAAERALSTGKVDVSGLRASHEGVLRELKLPVPAEVEELLLQLDRILSGVALLKELSLRTRDLIVSFGERLSVRIFAAVFNAEQAAACLSTVESTVKACALDSWEIGLITTSGYGSADSAFSQVEVVEQAYENIARSLRPLGRDYAHIPVVTGYIARDMHGTITTLGRDGSDLTATIIAAALQASEVQIWKDVMGILTTDPRLVPAARPVGVLTYEEAAELSTFGAKVVHPAAVMPAWLASVPMSIRNSTAPEQSGTRIVAKLGTMDVRDGRVVAMSCKRDITMIVIRSTRMLGQHGFLAHVFQVFNQFQVSVDVIATSEVTVSLTLDQGFKAVELDRLQEELQAVASVEVRKGMSMITLLTAKSDATCVLRDAFATFEKEGVVVEMVSHGASNVNVTFVLAEVSLLLSARKLHEVFFER